MVNLLAHRVESAIYDKMKVEAAKSILKLYLRDLIDKITLGELQEKYFDGKEEHREDLEKLDWFGNLQKEATDSLCYTLIGIEQDEVSKMSDSDRFYEIQKINESSQ